MIDWVQRAVFQPYSGRKTSLQAKNQKEGPGMGQHGQRLLTAMLDRVVKFNQGRGPMASS